MTWDMAGWRVARGKDGIALTSPAGERTLVDWVRGAGLASGGLSGALDRATERLNRGTDRALDDRPAPHPTGRAGGLLGSIDAGLDRVNSGLDRGVASLEERAHAANPRLLQGDSVVVTLPDATTVRFRNGLQGRRRSLNTATLTLAGRTYARRATGRRSAAIERDGVALATVERAGQDARALEEGVRFELTPSAGGLDGVDEIAVMILCEACGPVGADGALRNSVRDIDLNPFT